jgi:hypothetical protein
MGSWVIAHGFLIQQLCSIARIASAKSWSFLRELDGGSSTKTPGSWPEIVDEGVKVEAAEEKREVL